MRMLAKVRLLQNQPYVIAPGIVKVPAFSFGGTIVINLVFFASLGLRLNQVDYSLRLTPAR